MEWYNNGSEEDVFEPGDEPAGWVAGRLTSGGSGSNPIIRNFPDGSVRRSTDGGETWTVTYQPPAESAAPPLNLGNGVFKDEQGYYREPDTFVADAQGQRTEKRKEYITEAEARRLTAGEDTTSANAAANTSLRAGELAQRQREFDANYALQMEEYQRSIYEFEVNAASAQANLDFLMKKEAYAQSQDDKRLLLDTQQQVFNQQQVLADAQFKVASAKMQAQQFNAQMQMQAEQMNRQFESDRQDRLQSLNRDIATAGADAGDRGLYAGLVTANRGFGQQDEALLGANLFSEQSLAPLENQLALKEEVQGQPSNPYTFTPVPFDLGGIQMPTPMPETGSPGGYLDQAAVPDPTVDPTPNLTIEQAAMVPDWVKRKARADERLPGMADGGMVQGAYIAGDSPDGEENEEINIPYGPGQALVISSRKVGPKAFKAIKEALGGMRQMQDGGVFGAGLINARPRATGFLSEASATARRGTPFATGVLPTPVFASSPGFDPVVAKLLGSINQQERGLPMESFLRQASILAPRGMGEGVVGRTR